MAEDKRVDQLGSRDGSVQPTDWMFVEDALTHLGYKVPVSDISSAAGGVQSITPGSGIAVDNTDPLHPIVTNTGGGGGGSAIWGGITGTIGSQTDLTAALNAKAPLASPDLTGAPTTPTPTTTQGIANKFYVDSVAQGLTVKISVEALGAANTVLSGLQTIDGISLSASDRVLLINQTTASQNGLWVVQSGAWTRPADFLSGSTQKGSFTFVEGGTVYKATGWVLIGTSFILVDTSPQTWTQFSSGGGGGGGSSAWGGITGTLSAQTDLQTALNAKALDSTVVHNTGNETVAGIKTFSSAPIVPLSSFPETAITNLTADLALKAPLASPALTGTPTAPTASPGTNSTQIATTAYADASVPTATFAVSGKVKKTDYNVLDYGLVGDGVTDDTSALNTLISTVLTAGGGTIRFQPTSANKYLFNGAWVIPYTLINVPRTNSPVQASLRFTTSNGPRWDGYLDGDDGNVVFGGIVLDLRYNGGGSQVAKIDTRGAGMLEIDHLTLASGGTDNYPFMQTTNTTVFIHNNTIIGNAANATNHCQQDFLIWAGQTQTFGAGATDAFQGYGSRLWDNKYCHIRAGSVFGNFVNSVQIDNETFDFSCGSNLAHGAPYYFDSGSMAGNETQGVKINGGTIEVPWYPYMVSMIQNASRCSFLNMSYWDPQPPASGNGISLGQFYFGTGCTQNMIMAWGYTADQNKFPVCNGPAAGQQQVIDARFDKLAYLSDAIAMAEAL